ncbi:hypothetical protein DMUE_3964 [Dictyocoela muelleri]|nr:hypothetical protein DMUE_3964 [Dictyocoela muelleri]
MCPNEADISINRDSVSENQLKYRRKFIKATYRKRNDIFNINEEVLIKNEIRNSKMDKEFIEKGKVLDSIGNSCYHIKMDDGRVLIRHKSQLRFNKGDVGSNRFEVSNRILDLVSD